MPRNVDHIINAAQDSKVAVRRLHCAVAGEVRPVTPVLALGVLVVLAIVLRYKAVAVSPDSLENPRPGIANADVPSLTRSGLHLFAFFIEDHRIDSRQCRPGAAGNRSEEHTSELQS